MKLNSQVPVLTKIEDIKMNQILPVKCKQKVEFEIKDVKLKEMVDTLKDLFGENSRRTGRTLVMALAFVSMALDTPGKKVLLFDHTLTQIGLKAIEREVRNIVENYLPNGLVFELENIDSFRSSLTFKE